MKLGKRCIHWYLYVDFLPLSEYSGMVITIYLESENSLIFKAFRKGSLLEFIPSILSRQFLIINDTL